MGGYIAKDKFIYNNDIINLVLQSIDYGSVWKNIRLVSNNIHLLSIKYQKSKLIELANPILTLVYLCPKENWNHYFLSSIIPIDFIRLTYDKIPWTNYMISRSAGITINDILKADPNFIDWNESIRIEDIRDNLDKNWCYYRLAENNSLSIDDLSTIIDLSNSTYWWNNENATYADVIKYSNILNSRDNISILIDIIPLDENILQSYIDRYPDIIDIRIHKYSLTPNIIRNNLHINWAYIEIDYSKFTVDEIVTLNKFNIEYIFDHPDFTIDDFFKYYDISTFTEWYLLSSAHWLTFDIILKYKDIIPWDHRGFYINPNVTIDILEDSNFSWIEWDYRLLSEYAQLNWIYIVENSNKNWDSSMLVYNKNLLR